MYKRIILQINENISVLYSLIARGIQTLGTLLIIYLTTLYLKPDEKGYYFTFLSILSLQRFFEMGLYILIIQYVSHERVNIKFQKGEKIEGKEEDLSRLKSLFDFVIKWFSISSLCLFLVLIVSGYMFFSKVHTNILWDKPWILLSFSSSLVLFFKALISFDEGLGSIEDVYKVKMIQVVVETFVLVICLFLNLKLYSLGISMFFSFLILLIYCIIKRDMFIQIFNIKKINKHIIDWKKEIMPYQIKLAISTFAGFIVFQSITPLIFQFKSPSEAGKYGLTQNVLAGISSISTILLTVNISKLSILIAEKDYTTLRYLFYNILKKGSLLFFLGIIIFVLFIYLSDLEDFTKNIKYSFLPIFDVFLLSIAAFFHFLNANYATLIRCFKVEKFMLNTVTTGLLLMATIPFFAIDYSLTIVNIIYLLISMFSSYWGYRIFIDTKKAFFYE